MNRWVVDVVSPGRAADGVQESLHEVYTSLDDGLVDALSGPDRSVLLDDMWTLGVAEREESLSDLRAWQGRVQTLVTLIPVVMAFAASRVGTVWDSWLAGVSIVAGVATLAIGFQVLVVGARKSGLQLHSVLTDPDIATDPAVQIRVDWLTSLSLSNRHLGEQALTTFHQTVMAGVCAALSLMAAALTLPGVF